MIRHIVLYTYKEEVDQETIKKIYQDLDEISSKLPGRLSYSWGKYDSNEGRNKGYTHALITDFKDVNAQKAFLTDEVRVKFSENEVIPRMVGGVNGIVSFDFVWPQ